jgi:hypothetical protein
MSLAKRNSLAAGKEQSRVRKMVSEAKTQRDTDKAAEAYKKGGMVKGKPAAYMCGGKVGKK